MMSATSLLRNKVRNVRGEYLGRIEDLVIDPDTGGIAYAVLVHGGFLGIGEKLLAVPWDSLHPSSEEHELILNVEREHIAQTAGFDRGDWPEQATALLRVRF